MSNGAGTAEKTKLKIELGKNFESKGGKGWVEYFLDDEIFRMSCISTFFSLTMANCSGNVSPAPPPFRILRSDELIQLCSNCDDPHPQIWRGGLGERQPLRFLISNHLELIVLQLCLITLISFSIVLTPISKYKEVVFGAQPHRCEFRGENGLDQLGFNCDQLCSSYFRSYLSHFRDLGIFQYIYVWDQSYLPPPHCQFWSRPK